MTCYYTPYDTVYIELDSLLVYRLIFVKIFGTGCDFNAIELDSILVNKTRTENHSYSLDNETLSNTIKIL